MLFIFRFVWWSARWVCATVFFLAVMAFAGYYVLNYALAGGEYVRVPNIVHRHVTDASYVLAESGLEMGKIEEMPDDHVPRGHVIAQRPPAGKVVRTGRKVSPIVSSGTELMPAPNFLRRPLSEARDELQQLSFAVGTVARIPHATPRDTIIAQDPPPSMRVRPGTTIHFLVSESRSALTFLMPDLVGRPVEDVLRILSPMGVMPVPRRVESAAMKDVVLDQEPAVGTLIHEGEKVFYSVCPSGAVALPDAGRRAKVTYTVPQSATPCEVRVDTVDRNQVRQTVFPRDVDYVFGAPPRLVSGQSITIPIWFFDELAVEVFLDGVKVQSRYYKGDAEPVVTEFAAP